MSFGGEALECFELQNDVLDILTKGMIKITTVSEDLHRTGWQFSNLPNQ
jgi:hypothetical protein